MLHSISQDLWKLCRENSQNFSRSNHKDGIIRLNFVSEVAKLRISKYKVSHTIDIMSSEVIEFQGGRHIEYYVVHQLVKQLIKLNKTW